MLQCAEDRLSSDAAATRSWHARRRQRRVVVGLCTCETFNRAFDGTFDGTFGGTFDGAIEVTFEWNVRMERSNGTFDGTFEWNVRMDRSNGAFEWSVRMERSNEAFEWSVRMERSTDMHVDRGMHVEGSRCWLMYS